MKFSREVRIADIVSMLLFLTALMGLSFTYLQLKENNKTQRAIFFKDLYSAIFSDPVIRYAFQVIESRQPLPVDQPGFHLSEAASAIDRLLSQCELISALYLRGSLSDHEMVHFNYNLKRGYENPNIKRYVHQIDEWSKRRGIRNGPYSTFRSLGEKLVSDGPTRATTVGAPKY